jgi:ADP-ribose pyrophosphatase YjhB (NUDIX family)
MKRFTLKEFKEIYSKVPRICVDLVVKNNKGQYLLTKRAIEPSKGMWHIPGGTVLYGEKLAETAKRVAQEELGVKIEVTGQIGVTQIINPKVVIAGHDVSVQLLVEIKSPIKLDNQASEYGYFNPVPENTILEQKDFLNSLIDVETHSLVK